MSNKMTSTTPLPRHLMTPLPHRFTRHPPSFHGTINGMTHCVKVCHDLTDDYLTNLLAVSGSHDGYMIPATYSGNKYTQELSHGVGGYPSDYEHMGHHFVRQSPGHYL